MKHLFVIIASIFIITSCGPSQQEYDALLAQKNNLEIEVLNLQQVIENYENTPDRLYSTVETLVNNKDIEGLSTLCKKFEKYHPASAEYKKTKTALKKLTDEKAAKEKAEKEKRMKAVNKLRKTYDDVSGITWYQNQYFTHHNDENLMSIYIGKKDSNIWMRLKMSYKGYDWIFFEQAYLSYDGNTKQILFSRYDDKKTDNYGERVWEWIDVSVNNELLSYLKEMANGKTLKIRLSGKYTHTRNLDSSEKKALQDVLLAYDVLKNGE